jgi:hypothetical protein
MSSTVKVAPFGPSKSLRNQNEKSEKRKYKTTNMRTNLKNTTTTTTNNNNNSNNSNKNLLQQQQQLTIQNNKNHNYKRQQTNKSYPV